MTSTCVVLQIDLPPAKTEAAQAAYREMERALHFNPRAPWGLIFMAKDLESLLTGEPLDEDMELTLSEFCRTCRLQAECVFELVEEGTIDPL